jgi:hypothetical protein
MNFETHEENNATLRQVSAESGGLMMPKSLSNGLNKNKI